MAKYYQNYRKLMKPWV